MLDKILSSNSFSLERKEYGSYSSHFGGWRGHGTFYYIAELDDRIASGKTAEEAINELFNEPARRTT